MQRNSAMELYELPMIEVAEKIRTKEVSPVEVTQSSLARLEEVEPTLTAFATTTPELAREQAKIAEKEISDGNYRSPLHGVPLAVKDLYDTAGVRTTSSSAQRADHVPDTDSVSVAKLYAAGMVLIGKTHTHEFAYGATTPTTGNPWAPDRTPGGSSGGSGAAVAGGVVHVALGSDTGGSIRIPAALCGTVGLKPTFGRASRVGVVPHSWSLDHAGPLSYTVADSVYALNAISGHDPKDPGSARTDVPDFTAALGQPITDLRVGICRNHMFDNNQPDVDAAIEAAARLSRDAGAELVDFELPILAFSLGAIFAIELSSSTAYHSRNLASGAVTGFTNDVRTLVEMGRLVTGPDYLKAEQLRRVLIDDLAKVFADVDVIIGPTCPLTAWPIGKWTVRVGAQDESVLPASWRLAYPWNLVGFPAIALPWGVDLTGPPIGLQLAARPFDEMTLIRAADAYERGHGWKDMHPKL